MEELYVESGINAEAIFEAFKHYKLKEEITDDDKIRYRNIV